MMLTLRIDAIDDVAYDPKAKRYRVISGAGIGSFLSRQAYLSLVDRHIDKQAEKLQTIGQKLTSGQITVRQFQFEAGEALRNIHAAAAILGRGGIDKMQNADWLQVQNTLKQQLYKGRGEDGKSFGLKHLTEEYRSGTISTAQFNARLAMYGQSGRLTFAGMEVRTNQEQGMTEAKRILNATVSCAECSGFAALGWTKLEDLVLPGVGCSCRSNCRCTVEYRTSAA